MVTKPEQVQPPQGAMPNLSNTTPVTAANQFPYPNSIARLNEYDYYARLFMGEHYSAFRIRIDSAQYNAAYSRLRYVMVNFAGLVSKIVADMLFSEPIVVKVPEGDQDWVDAFWHENNLDVQLYESALSNSYLGDALFKLRVGPLLPGDPESVVIAEDITPRIYFPKIDGFNVRAEPSEVELAWTFKVGDKETYLRKEVHTSGLVTNQVFKMDGMSIAEAVGLNILGVPGLTEMQPTGIKQMMTIHVPNWKTGDRHFGISDYFDMDTLFYAVNNRMTKIDNVLDKHGDPILMVPQGVLDEKGNVNKKALGVIEIVEGENNKPEYIVWDASLENAFKEIEKLVEFMYLVGEISPDVLGIGQGVSDSGRALKFKLMRTIAKVARKKLYYDRAIKELVFRAQLLAKAHNLKADGLSLQGEPQRPEIDWQDGLPIDESEQIDTETKALDAGVTSKRAAIMRIYKVDEETADEILAEAKKETTVPLPGMNLGNIDKNMMDGKGNMPGKENMPGKPNMPPFAKKE